MTRRILVSACLLGRPVRYDGRGRALAHEALTRWQAEGLLVPLCPEVAAGLPTPRAPAEIVGGDGEDVLAGRARVVDGDGRDLTAEFLAGAESAARLAAESGCAFALLTEGSPSCGPGFVYDGTFSGARRPGSGVVAARLRRAGVEVFAEDEVERLALRLSADRAG
ncbi:MAG TPA: DUF523 domain-containing protein [Caulobacteraceae bacterium]|nr:DUF523 domain-containing protein [Caulobacteraceae bacterium]